MCGSPTITSPNPSSRNACSPHVSRAKKQVASKAALMTQNQLKSLLSSLEGGTVKAEAYLKSLLIPAGNRDTFVNVDEIAWVEAADYDCCLHVGAKSFMLRETIKQLAATLDPRSSSGPPLHHRQRSPQNPPRRPRRRICGDDKRTAAQDD
jgi:hypothetical protein